MRIAIVVILSCLFVSCANVPKEKFEVLEQDYGLVAFATLKLIDRTGEISTIVVPVDADPRARAALAELRKVISPAEIPRSGEYTLPGGYFLLTTFRIADGEALVEGQLGPVSRGLTSVNLPDCGKTYSIPWYLEKDGWVNHSYKKTICSETRELVPIDEVKRPR